MKVNSFFTAYFKCKNVANKHLHFSQVVPYSSILIFTWADNWETLLIYMNEGTLGHFCLPWPTSYFIEHEYGIYLAFLLSSSVNILVELRHLCYGNNRTHWSGIFLEVSCCVRGKDAFLARQRKISHGSDTCQGTSLELLQPRQRPVSDEKNHTFGRYCCLVTHISCFTCKPKPRVGR